MSRFNRKSSVDKNQGDIVDALKKVGATVEFLTAVGSGCPDLLVGWRRRNFLLEVKNPATRYGQGKDDNATRTLEAQKEWHQSWRGHVVVVRTIDEAFEAIGVRRSE